MDRMCI